MTRLNPGLIAALTIENILLSSWFQISLLFLKVENILWPGWLSDLNETWSILTQISGL